MSSKITNSSGEIIRWTHRTDSEHVTNTESPKEEADALPEKLIRPGEIMIQHETFLAIHEHIEHARTKHPWPANMPDAEKYRIAEHELQEMGVAMLKGDVRGARKEALDCVAVLIRIVEGE